MNKRKIIGLTIIFGVLFLPIWMWIAWLLTPKQKFVVAIIDKTVLTSAGQEHASLTWVLKHLRYAKTSAKLYDLGDYFGFFPDKNQKYRIKGMERFNNSQLGQLSRDADMVFYTDTYGIYKQEWFAGENQTERSGMLYGGMSMKDVEFLKKMKENHKMILMEFNDINSPTEPLVRSMFESEFSVSWTGWIGRYFESLDTTNFELPRWLIRNYKKQHNGEWNFKKSGIAFIREDDRVVILENDKHLSVEIPFILPDSIGSKYYDLPDKMKFSFWFDIIQYNPKVNQAIANYQIYTNDTGAKELAQNGIPSKFPAILAHRNTDYHFYYFAGDFSDNPISMTSAYFKGFEHFSGLFYKDNHLVERNEFFWKIYRPLVSEIIRNYEDTQIKHKRKSI